MLILLAGLLMSGFVYADDDAPSTDLPIDITAIGRQVTATPVHSLWLLEIEMFTPASRALYEAMARQRYVNRTNIEASLFARFVEPELINEHEHVAAAALNAGLFMQPVVFRTIGQAGDDNPIPLWLIALVMMVCVVAGYGFARMVIKRKERN